MAIIDANSCLFNVWTPKAIEVAEKALKVLESATLKKEAIIGLQFETLQLQNRYETLIKAVFRKSRRRAACRYRVFSLQDLFAGHLAFHQHKMYETVLSQHVDTVLFVAATPQGALHNAAPLQKYAGGKLAFAASREACEAWAGWPEDAFWPLALPSEADEAGWEEFAAKIKKSANRFSRKRGVLEQKSFAVYYDVALTLIYALAPVSKSMLQEFILQREMDVGLFEFALNQLIAKQKIIETQPASVMSIKNAGQADWFNSFYFGSGLLSKSAVQHLKGLAPIRFDALNFGLRNKKENF